MCYLKTGKYDSARIYFQRVFDNANLMLSEQSWKGIALGNIGKTYFLQNNFEKAAEYLMQAIPLTIEGNVHNNTVPFASNLSIIFLKENFILLELFFHNPFSYNPIDRIHFQKINPG